MHFTEGDDMDANTFAAALGHPDVAAAVDTLQTIAARHGLHVVVAVVLMRTDGEQSTVALLEPGADPQVQHATARALDAAAQLPVGRTH